MSAAGERPITAAECVLRHEGLAERLDTMEANICGRLDTLNGGVEANTKFRVQAQAILGVVSALALAWGATAIILLLR